jgi:hypothetical protein
MTATGRAYPFDSDALVPVDRVLGQSYVTNPWGTIGDVIGASEPALCLTPYYEGAGITPHQGPVGPGAGISTPGQITDVIGVPQSAPLSLASAYSIALQRICRRAGFAERPRLFYTAGFPGSSWYDTGDHVHYLAPGSAAWANDVALQGYLPTILTPYGKAPLHENALWFQGGDATYALSLQALADMTAANDALNLPVRAPGLHFFIGQVAARSDKTEANAAADAQLDFCRANANGRSWLIGPWHQHAFASIGSGDPGYVHPGPVGTALMGEAAALAVFAARRLNLAWNPLWRSSAPCTISGNVVTIPLQRPPGPDYASGALTIDTTTIAQAPGWGLNLKRGGVIHPAQSVSFSGDAIVADFGSFSPAAGDELSNAEYGPGQSAPYTHSGVWSNIKLTGPASTLIAGSTVDAWLVAFRETL